MSDSDDSPLRPRPKPKPKVINKNEIRKPKSGVSNAEFCVTCKKFLAKFDAHWFCGKCRKINEEAKCPGKCKACKAMVEESWRREALEKLIKKRKNDREQKKRKKLAMEMSPVKKSSSTKSVSSKKLKTVTPKKVAIPTSSKNESYTKLLNGYEYLFYEDLNPVIPKSLVMDGFILPKIPTALNDRFYVVKNELIRLLSSASICYHLSQNRTEFSDENNQIFNASSDGIVSLFASLIKHKANDLSQVIFEIRAKLLSEAECADRKLIPQMINGPIQPRVSFFGNIEDLKQAVAKDKKNALRPKNLPRSAATKSNSSNSRSRKSKSKLNPVLEDVGEVSDAENSVHSESNDSDISSAAGSNYSSDM